VLLSVMVLVAKQCSGKQVVRSSIVTIMCNRCQYYYYDYNNNNDQ
jgi:hypothetical protein